MKLIKIGRTECSRCNIWSNMLEKHFPNLEIETINIDNEMDKITVDMRTALMGQRSLPFLLVEKDGELSSYPPTEISPQKFQNFLDK